MENTTTAHSNVNLEASNIYAALKVLYSIDRHDGSINWDIVLNEDYLYRASYYRKNYNVFTKEDIAVIDRETETYCIMKIYL